MRTARTISFLLLLIAGGLMAAISPSWPAAVVVIDHGWHTGLVIRRGDIPDGLWPEHREAPAGEYLEIGWGQREFYQTHGPSLLQALRAALWPAPSVLHLVGFSGSAQDMFPNSEWEVLEVDAAGMARLARYISDSYERDPSGRVKRLGTGLYGDSRFFAGRENFHLFRTCNVWTARALRLTGCPVDTGVMAANVMSSAARCAAHAQ